MILAGAGAALTFAPALASAAAIGGVRRGAAMALMNSAGCLGMLFGPIVSGIVIATLGRAYGVPILIAAAVVLVWGCGVLAWHAIGSLSLQKKRLSRQIA